MTPDLFPGPEMQPLSDGAVLLRGYCREDAAELLHLIERIAAAAPLRNMVTPGGKRMSVAMTNCGAQGWITDARGYRYTTADPDSGLPWPKMPALFANVAASAAAAAGYRDFTPDACLINCYEPGARLTLHQDTDEADLHAPIVSVSLGLPAKFLFGGLLRTDRVQRIMLEHGDVCVWGGPSRLAYHGIDTLKDDAHPATGRCRINLTFRKAS